MIKRTMMFPSSCLLIVILSITSTTYCIQTWVEQPTYTEVNPHGDVILKCRISDKRGECRWQKDGVPIGMFPKKYQWVSASSKSDGDCSLKIVDAQLKYDDGVWQCLVTPTSFQANDALISEGAQLIVRESPKSISMIRVGDFIEGSASTITTSSSSNSNKTTIGSAGDQMELECSSSGANPPSDILWFIDGRPLEGKHYTQKQMRDSNKASRTWMTVSRLSMLVTKVDNGKHVECRVEHPALDNSNHQLVAKRVMDIHYRPAVKIETTDLSVLEDQVDSLNLRCFADSNPPATIHWRRTSKSGAKHSSDIVSTNSEIRIDPVSRNSAGEYLCVAENGLGLSKPASVQIDVLYPPTILSVGPSSTIRASTNKQIMLECEADANPLPEYRWLQKSLDFPGSPPKIMSEDRVLVISNVSYSHQGIFICEAFNSIRGKERSIKSDGIKLEVHGQPIVVRDNQLRIPSAEQIHNNVIQIEAATGQEVELRVLFCSDPVPKQAWHLGDLGTGSGNHIILASGTGHGRFVAETLRKSNIEDCYISTLRIKDVKSQDSHLYHLRLSNPHGTDSHTFNLVVHDTHFEDYEIVFIVGISAIVSLVLFLVAICLCCRRISRIHASSNSKSAANKGGAGGNPSSTGCCYTLRNCCCYDIESSEMSDSTNGGRTIDMESERTDIESTHSSNCNTSAGTTGMVINSEMSSSDDSKFRKSEFRTFISNNKGGISSMSNPSHQHHHHTILPPDGLYGSMKDGRFRSSNASPIYPILESGSGGMKGAMGWPSTVAPPQVGGHIGDCSLISVVQSSNNKMSGGQDGNDMFSPYVQRAAGGLNSSLEDASIDNMSASQHDDADLSQQQRHMHHYLNNSKLIVQFIDSNEILHSPRKAPLL